MSRIVAIAVVCLAVSGVVIQQLVAAPPEEPVLANTAAVALANPNAVTILENAGEWRLEASAGSCVGGQVSVVVRNLSSQNEYVLVPALQQSPFQLTPGGTYATGAISPGAGFGAVGIQASDGYSTVFLTNQGLGYQCRITATMARAPQEAETFGSDTHSVVGVLPHQASQTIVVLAESDWQIELGTVGAGVGCQVFGSDPDPGAPFVFRNLSNQTVTVQGTPVPSGGTLNLGKSWPTLSNPTGALQITMGGSTQTAYLTGGFVDGVECWGTANVSLTP